jgi:hypothetical protein
MATEPGDRIEMTSRRRTVRRCSATALRGALGAVMGVSALMLVVATLAQEAQPPSPVPGQAPLQAPGPAPSQAPNESSSNPSQSPAFQPGFIDALGRWLEEGASKLKSGVQGAREQVDQLGSKAREAAKDATGAVGSLPNARAVTARERCAPAANGAPDCQTAAVTLCRGKGFQTGKSLDTQTEQKCSAKFLLEGRAPNASDCPPEMFVTRAMCQ